MERIKGTVETSPTAERRKLKADQPSPAGNPSQLAESSSPAAAKRRTYFGGKDGSGTYQTIINQIRPHLVYIEPFAGAAGIMRRKRLAKYSLLCDLDAVPLAALQTRLEADGFTSVHLCGLPVTMLCQHGGEFPVVSLRNVTYENILEEIRDYAAEGQRVCVYFDPPYPHSTRKSGNRNRYKYEFTDEDHEQFLRFVLSLPENVDVLISTYPNDRYRKALTNWRLIEFQSVTHAGLATEWLFVNYPEPTELHDYRYVGSDHRDRLDFSRMKNRWKKKLDKLPPVKRRALLQHILGGESEGLTR